MFLRSVKEMVYFKFTPELDQFKEINRLASKGMSNIYLNVEKTDILKTSIFQV